MLALSWLVTGASAEPSWNRLYADQAFATTFLQSNWNKYTENYHPNYALDGDARTAWVEGADGDGVGSVLSWDVSALSSARAVKLRIRNGYQKSAGLLTANAAPREVAIQVWRNREVVVERVVTLERSEGWQEVILETGGKGFNHLELAVRSVHPGATYKDTCVSDVETWVDSDVPYKASFEVSKDGLLKAWIAERVKTAAYFASLPPTWPFVSTKFEDTGSDTTEAVYEPIAAPLRTAYAALPTSGPVYRDVIKGAPEKLPDGLWPLTDDLRSRLRTADASFFETDSDGRTVSLRPTEDEGDWASERHYGNLRLVKAGAEVVVAAHTLHEVYEGRITTTTDSTHLYRYEAGRLVELYETRDQFDELRTVTERVFRFRWNAAGKIDRIEMWERGDAYPGGPPVRHFSSTLWTPSP